MGEYWNGHKLGTCESLLYVRREEIAAAAKRFNDRRLEVYLKPHAFFYRFPWPDEDGQDITAADSRDYFRTEVINCPELAGIPHQEVTVAVNVRGCFIYSVNVWIPCPASPAFNLRSSWAGRPVIIVAEKYDQDGCPYTVLGCGYCDQWFHLDSEAEAEIVRRAVRARGGAEPAHRQWYDQVAARIHPKRR